MTPEQAADYEHGMRTMAGSALHFITGDPEIFAGFVAWFGRSAAEVGLPPPPPEVIRLIVSQSHEWLTPGCSEPIEAM